MEIDLLCNLFDQLVVTERSLLPSEDEGILCRVFGHLSISGVVSPLPSSYNILPVGYQKQIELGNLIHSWNLSGGDGLRGATFSLSIWAKGKGQFWVCLLGLCWTQSHSGGILFLGRQIQRDFFLFISYSGVRQKNDWLAFGYFEDAQSWRKFLFYILWRYKTFGNDHWLYIPWRYIIFDMMQRRFQCMLLVSVMISKQVSATVHFQASQSRYFSSSAIGFILFHVFRVVFCCLLGLVGSCNGVSITVIFSDLYLHGEFLRQVVKLEEIHFLVLSTREICCVVISGWYLRRVHDFFAKRDLSLPTRVTASKFHVMVPLVLTIWAVCYLLLLCCKVGDGLLLEMDYPNFDLFCPGRWKLTTVFPTSLISTRRAEEVDQLWSHGTSPCGGGFSQIV